jgi:transposase
MSEISTELVRRLVTRRKSDGRCVYDPAAKAEIIRACMQPGVSVARIAMQAGINANLVRSWIGKKRGADVTGRDEPASRRDGGAAFVALRLETAQADPSVVQRPKLRLHVCLPNGVEFDLGEAGLDELSSVMRILGSLSCSGSTNR